MSSSQTAYANSPYPLIKGYSIGPDIAEGGFSRVYKAYNPTSPPPGIAAIKVISLVNRDSNPTLDEVSYKRIKKEIKVHKSLKHDNILELIDSFEDEIGIPERGIPPAFYIILGYAVGGDLFDQLVPDVGLCNDHEVIHFYFRQLMSAVYFCHVRGIVHRDLKPENILLDGRGNLLISDFGLCSVYRHNGKERLLTEICGSAPYAAPELALGRPYHGPAIDIWSSGIILYVLLVGNTPWDTPTISSPEFAAYVNGVAWETDPWNRIEPELKEILLQLMNIDPEIRITLPQLTKNPWFRRNNLLMNSRGLAKDGIGLALRLAQQRGELNRDSEVETEADKLISELKASSLVNGDNDYVEEEDEDAEEADGGVVGKIQLSQEVARSQAANRFMNDINMNPTQPFSCTVRLFTSDPVLASQKMQHNNISTMFISHSTIEELIESFTRALKTLGIQYVVKSLDSNSNNDNPLRGEAVMGGVKIAVSFIDNRKQRMLGSLRIEPIELTDEPTTMETDEKEDDDRSRVSQAWGVIFKRQKGDVLQWKKTYEELVRLLPSGVVVSK